MNSQKIVRPEVELTDVNITRISPLNTKELLVATEGAGVHKLNIDTYETDPYIIANYGSYNEMDGNIINDVYVDNEQRIWLSNYPTGITVRNNQYTNYNWIKHSIGNRQSLVNNQVNSIIEDSDGDLWFGTSNGISLYDSKQKQWRSFLSSFNHGLKIRTAFLLLYAKSLRVLYGREDMHRAFPDYQEKRKHRIPHPCPILPSECTCRQIHTRH